MSENIRSVAATCFRETPKDVFIERIRKMIKLDGVSWTAWWGYVRGGSCIWVPVLITNKGALWATLVAHKCGTPLLKADVLFSGSYFLWWSKNQWHQYVLRNISAREGKATKWQKAVAHPWIRMPKAFCKNSAGSRSMKFVIHNPISALNFRWWTFLKKKSVPRVRRHQCTRPLHNYMHFAPWHVWPFCLWRTKMHCVPTRCQFWRNKGRNARLEKADKASVVLGCRSSNLRRRCSAHWSLPEIDQLSRECFIWICNSRNCCQSK